MTSRLLSPKQHTGLHYTYGVRVTWFQINAIYLQSKISRNWYLMYSRSFPPQAWNNSAFWSQEIKLNLSVSCILKRLFLSFVFVFFWMTLCLFPVRPHVVTVQWLVDCFTKGCVLPEDGYLHPGCLPPSPAAVSLPVRQTSTSRLSAAPQIVNHNTPRNKKAEEDLLSQYMDDEPTVGKCLCTW